MATAQTLPVTCTPRERFGEPYPAAPPPEPPRCSMGSVGSLVEKPDVSSERLRSGRAGGPPAGGLRQQDGLLRKGFTQRELLNYLNISKKEPKAGKHIFSSISSINSIKREHGHEEENIYTKVYHKDGKDLDLGKNSLPIPGKYEKSRFRPSAFKPVTPKNFSSMQNLYPAKAEELDNGLSNGLQVSYAKVASTAVSSSSSSSSPSRHAPGGGRTLPAGRGPSREEENMSDSGHNSMNSLPPYRPPFRPHLGQISASMGHINHIGSLDRASTSTEASCPGSAAPGLGLGRAQAVPYGSEAPPPYELSHSLEDVVRDLEDRLLEKEHELKQMRRNLDESEGAIAQVFEGKQRLWEKEVEELKRLYAAKLRQVSQHAQRSQRSLQLQLYKAQQERRRLQEDLEALQAQSQALRGRCAGPHSQDHNPQLEETQWEVCQKSGEISLLKQQLRDAQAEVAQKLSEIFHLKTQLRETRGELRDRDSQIQLLQLALQGAPRPEEAGGAGGGAGGGAEARPGGRGGSAEERLRAELLLERRQSEAQASAFEAERRTWQTEKEKVIRYQKELQASYLEMYHKNQALERELQELRDVGEEGATWRGRTGRTDCLPACPGSRGSSPPKSDFGLRHMGGILFKTKQ
ncbi:hypothetical protein MATL_G00169870 [Megalops atlanticus]|uniref:NEDD4 binding protein 3 n=1 Tax=Megalops atlanticus TaxID=7932 RepID=A0A9D3T0L3_MEGAT|nr:hypothetical protein MATL_G00169870 [Megalops atlanticus]